MKYALIVAGLLAATPAMAAAVAPIPAGHYTLDKPHGSLTFRIDHLGFSHYTARFSRFDAALDLDPEHPERARVTARVDAASLDPDSPPPGFVKMLTGPDWLDAKKYPTMTFRSTKVVRTGPHTARVTGAFTMHGVTRPVTLDVTFNGGWAGIPLDPHARVGFSAHGTLKRSAFGVSAGLPPPGTHMGVGDDIDIAIEAEFSGPPWKPKT